MVLNSQLHKKSVLGIGYILVIQKKNRSNNYNRAFYFKTKVITGYSNVVLEMKEVFNLM